MLTLLLLTPGLFQQRWWIPGPPQDGPVSAIVALDDFDGDGVSEIAVGRPQGQASVGWTGGFVRLRSGDHGQNLRTLGSRPGGALSGFALARARDHDGDGRADLLIGAPLAHGRAPASGLVSVVSSGTGIPHLSLEGTEPYGRFGAALTEVDDIDGDGVRDFLVGAPGEDRTGLDSGAVYLHSGRDGRLLWRLDGAQARAGFGTTIQTVADMNGDQIEEIAVAAPGSLNDPGEVFFLDGTSGKVLRRWYGTIPGGRYGKSLAEVGDWDGDGRSELAIGSPASDAGTLEIRALDGVLLTTLHGDQVGSRFGAAVSSAGDLNGDGVEDFVVGSPGAENGRGQVRLHSGIGGRRLETVPGRAPGGGWGSALARRDSLGIQPGFVAAGTEVALHFGPSLSMGAPAPNRYVSQSFWFRWSLGMGCGWSSFTWSPSMWWACWAPPVCWPRMTYSRPWCWSPWIASWRRPWLGWYWGNWACCSWCGSWSCQGGGSGCGSGGGHGSGSGNGAGNGNNGGGGGGGGGGGKDDGRIPPIATAPPPPPGTVVLNGFTPKPIALGKNRGDGPPLPSSVVILNSANLRGLGSGTSTARATPIRQTSGRSSGSRIRNQSNTSSRMTHTSPRSPISRPQTQKSQPQVSRRTISTRPAPKPIRSKPRATVPRSRAARATPSRSAASTARSARSKSNPRRRP